MYSHKFLHSLPKDVDKYIESGPTRADRFLEQLKGYKGRLKKVVSQISVEEVREFLNFIHNRVSQEEQQSKTAAIISTLKKDYDRDISSVNPAELFFLTKSNNIHGLSLDRIPIDRVATALWQKQQIISAFNHPFRIRLRQIYEADLKHRYPASEPYDPLPPLRSPYLADSVINGQLDAFEEFTAAIVAGQKKSRQLALAIGPYTIVGRHHVAIPIGSETMPDVVGSPIALASLVQCHALAGAPRNNIFVDPKVQAKLIRDTLTILRESPVLSGRRDKALILAQWQRNLGIVVEPDPYKACHRIETVLNSLKSGESIGYVRIYMVEGADEMYEVAQVIRRYFPKLEIYMGQIVREDQALTAQELGVDSIGLGITSGSRCSTAARSGVQPQNMQLLYRIRQQGIRIPIYSETGIPHHAMPVALSAGISRVNYSAGVLGWLCAVGGIWGFKNRRGEYLHPYDGEAGEKAKYAEDRWYSWNMPVMLEGVNGWHRYDPRFPTIPHMLWYLGESMVLCNTFHRHLFHEDLLYDREIAINHMSEALVAQVRPYEHF